MTVAERFWSKVDASGGVDSCWLWTGGVKVSGNRRGKPLAYGRFCLADGTTRPAHRFAHELATGDAPSGLVCHTCDNPLCCNPAHLYDGDAKTNALDCVERGRHAIANGSYVVPKPWTRERILDAIRRFAETHGRPPTTTDWKKKTDEWPSCRVVYGRDNPFPKWADAIEAAGFPRPEMGRYGTLVYPRVSTNCVDCGEERKVSTGTLSAIKKGRLSGRCNPCKGVARRAASPDVTCPVVWAT